MRSTFRLVLGTLVLLVVFGCGDKKAKTLEARAFDKADFPSVQNSVYGGWHQDNSVKGADGITTSLNLYLNAKNEVGFERSCAHWPDSVVASATLPVDISSTVIDMKLDYSIIEKGVGSVPNCELTVKKSSIPYRLDGDHLHIQGAAGEDVSFTRIP